MAIFIKRVGECRMCGKCCVRKYIESGMNDEQKEQARINAEKGGRKIKKLREQCKHLERRKGGTFICRIWQNRPKHCRDFPADPEDIFWEGCGYRFVEYNDETGEQKEIPLSEKAKGKK